MCSAILEAQLISYQFPEERDQVFQVILMGMDTGGPPLKSGEKGTYAKLYEIGLHLPNQCRFRGDGRRQATRRIAIHGCRTWGTQIPPGNGVFGLRGKEACRDCAGRRRAKGTTSLVRGR
jgi:hypothetical protein